MGEATIDPRIRARRIAVRRDEGRRRLSRLVRLTVLVGVILLGVLATRTPLLDVDRVELTGNAHTPPDVLLGAAGIRVGDPMTDVDLAAARRAIDGLPWVDTVTVARRWPGTVRIGVTERTPAASVPAAQGGWLLVDASGRLLEPVDVAPTDLVALADVEPGAAAGAQLPAADDDALLVARSVPPSLVGRVVAVARTDAGLELRLDGGTVVAFGPAEEIEPKLVAVATVLGNVDLHCVAVIDVRVPSAPVLTHTPGCA